MSFKNRNNESVAQIHDLMLSDRRLAVDEMAGEVPHVRLL
jgi:hypothetical protein